jgi:DNA-binding HxlR family transcriptional regulator
MATNRTYGGGCAIADALDVIGERWALLAVRELMFGPKRYTDIQTGLPGVSPKVLGHRLRELEEYGVVRRRRLGPPTSAWVYELTDWGRELDTVLVHLGRWGRQSPIRERRLGVSVDSLMLAVRAHFDPGIGGTLTAVYALDIDQDRFVVTVADGEMSIRRGEAADADAVIDSDAETFAAVLIGGESLDDAIGTGRLRVSGDVRLVRRLLDAMPSQPSAAVPAGT